MDPRFCGLPPVELAYRQRCFSPCGCWVTTMVLASGYWQVAMSTDAKRKAAFVTHEGMFQFRVMPFGLCNAPATFERLMDRVLCGMRWSRCLVYLEDVISFGTSISEALGRLEEVLCRLSDFGLQLKAKTCTFMQTCVMMLIKWFALFPVHPSIHLYNFLFTALYEPPPRYAFHTVYPLHIPCTIVMCMCDYASVVCMDGAGRQPCMATLVPQFLCNCLQL